MVIEPRRLSAALLSGRGQEDKDDEKQWMCKSCRDGNCGEWLWRLSLTWSCPHPLQGPVFRLSFAAAAAASYALRKTEAPYLYAFGLPAKWLKASPPRH
jgi:hypothetical protein